MNRTVPETLALIAGKGVYPRLLAEAARRQGVKRLFVIAFRGETNSSVTRLADKVESIHLGQLGHMLDALRRSRATCAVMAGQITPTNLFRVRLDKVMLTLLKGLPVRNAETIFGAVADAMKSLGIELLPASTFMEDYMPPAGQLSARAPSPEQEQDIRLGLQIAHTVVVKQGTVLAVEAFEGTDEAVRRAGRLGGPGAVVVKVAKPSHDMRFDIPVVGVHTLRVLRKMRAAVLAVQAGRCILLEREAIVKRADAIGLALVVVPTGREWEQKQDE